MKETLKEIFVTLWYLYLFTRPFVSATQSVERGHSWFAGFLGGLAVAVLLGGITFAVRRYLRSKASKTSSPPGSAGVDLSPHHGSKQAQDSRSSQ